MKDITKRPEKPVNLNQAKGPEMPFEQPSQVEVEKKFEAVRPLEVPMVTKEGKPQVEMPGPVIPSAPAPAVAKSPVLEKIENILEEDLSDVYFQMPPAKQEQFNKEGEMAASKIERLLRGVKIKVKKIFDLIRNWLKLIPGINKFFLEQEAKIKTDKILELQEKQKNQNKV